MPRVSVIVSFYNAERFLAEAIESVRAQTFRDWELLLVDDGSTDGSTAIARRYTEAEPQRTRLLHHPGRANRGVAASRNRGMAEARGELLALLDADDVWLPHKLVEQVRILDENPRAGMVFGPSLRWFGWTGRPEDQGRDYLPRLGVEPNRVHEPPRLLTLSIERKATTPCPSNVLLRRAVIERIGGFEESFTGPKQLYEDQVFFAKVTARLPVFVSDHCWDRYRRHPDSCVSVVKGRGESFAVRVAYLQWLRRYLDEQGIRDTDLQAALNRQLRTYRHPLLHRWRQRGRQLVAGSIEALKPIGRRTLPKPLRQWLWDHWFSRSRPL